MGFLKSFGSGAGSVIGGITGGIIKGIGEVTGSKFIQEVGDGVKESTEFAGKQLGIIAEGTWNVGSGLVTKDDSKIDHGFNDIGDGVGSTVKAVGQGIKSTVGNVGDVAGGLLDGDDKRWKQGLRDVGKTVAVGALGISILDAADVIDINGNEGDINGGQMATDEQPAAPQESVSDNNLQDSTDKGYITQDNPNHHDVQPHWRTLESGETIWVDGDGDSSINRTAEQGGGWNQSNPDFRTPVDKV